MELYRYVRQFTVESMAPATLDGHLRVGLALQQYVRRCCAYLLVEIDGGRQCIAMQERSRDAVPTLKSLVNCSRFEDLRWRWIEPRHQLIFRIRSSAERGRRRIEARAVDYAAEFIAQLRDDSQGDGAHSE